ncbi:Predicted unusual protein kinase regulating ubiquinone biosynthesis, AarF/ABC1/UbiB family [Halorientalis persicus]|uniref:Predicted unusual protein kinase regulating ubiquinone biosynthesis, AarF/ABC1/UbiB family n=1 Tax=Halorientalis persicus TaxID=1367881 RepID=A0A1H8D2M0_9EURY|nr:AarF/ABC1/UbiB kinase family protein [Halorientalis persicus]SEN01681.1 Predicted unusual protein kinase regulating ubiquinone biosynthesis, AarF/ABC1/UbiB family [Halorientalis persicus]
MNLRAYRRFVTVARQFLPLLLAYARDRNRFLLFGKSREVSAEQRRKRAATLLDSLLTLGPTFIKLGQLLSTRPDILPPEYIDEFTKLQDEVPPAPWDEAEQVLESELGPVEENYENFDTDSISGASLGQVYYAETENGPVAVKVRRPGIEDLVESDLRVIRWSVPIIMRFVDETRSFSLETLADEFAKTIRQEMDYGRERQMLEEISENFAEDQRVRIPDVDESRSTGRVLTMEYVPGTKISNISELDDLGVDRTEIAETLQRVYLQMIVEDGVFHADPHPGNLAVQEDGTLVFYDFGMSGYVDAFIQEKIIDFYMAVAEQDTDAILDTLIEMGTLSPEADRQVMGEVMELAIADARGEDIEQYRVQQIVQQVEDTIYEFPLRLPANLALVLRVATVVEGVCVTLDPDFDFISVATDYLRDSGYVEAGVRQFVEDRADEVQQAAQSALRTPPKLERTLDRIERDELRVNADIEDSDGLLATLAKRLVYGMALSAGIVSTAVLYAFSTVEAAGVAGGATVLVAGLLYWSFRSKKGIRAQPQFTRQSMREQQGGPGEDGSAVGEIDLGGGFGPDAAGGDEVGAAEDDDADRSSATTVAVEDGGGEDEAGTDIDVTTADEDESRS